MSTSAPLVPYVDECTAVGLRSTGTWKLVA